MTTRRTGAGAGSAATALRPRIVAAALALTTERGWSAVTMAKLADAVGVSRQTVYNEVGGKPALAEAMVLDELERFLGVVTGAFDRNPDRLVDAIRDAAHDVLVVAGDNPLLRAVVSATHGADTELLPLLTTHAETLLVAARASIADRLGPYDVRLGEERLDAAVDTVVRVVLSHVVQPAGPPAQAADAIAWIAGRVLAD